MSVDRLVNLVAMGLLRVRPPAEAYAFLKTIARVLPRRRNRLAVMRASQALSGARGTCLSRALTIASRAPGAEVVLGVQPDASTVSAHAWVEIDGLPLSPADRFGKEIARLS